MILAVIDLGTNTFHILIAEYSKGEFTQIARKRIYVYLAEKGIEIIGQASIERALAACKEIRSIIDTHSPQSCKIASTAALRTAQNGPDLAHKIEEILNYPVEIIDGNKEAELIYKGTKLIHPFSQIATSLIMDIGGGSVEFILVKNQKLFWAKSFPIGVAVLKKRFHKEEIIQPKEIDELKDFLSQTLLELKTILDQETPIELIGASGSFEVIQEMLLGKIISQATSDHKLMDFEEIYASLIHSTYLERIEKYKVPEKRADLIIVALVLIKFVLDACKLEKIVVSPYALKEGLLSEMANV